MSRNETAQTGIPDPEVVPAAKRRRFSAQYKLRILEEADACTEPGEIRKLAREAADNGLVDQTLANGIKTVKGVKSVGRGRPASPRGASSGVSTRADTSTATG